MSHAPHDLCLLFPPEIMDTNSKRPKCISCLQIDDSLILGDQDFHELEISNSASFLEEGSREIQVEPDIYLEERKGVYVYGTHLTKSDSGFNINASHHIKKLEKISVKVVEKSESVAQRALGAYIAFICRPDVTFAFSFAAQHQQDPNSKHARRLNKAIAKCLKSSQLGLRYVPLDTESSCICRCKFWNNSGYSSQLGFVTCLMDKHNTANIINYSCTKSKRITRSVLAAEIYAIVHGFDYGYVFRHTIGKIVGRSIPLKMFTNSKCLFDSFRSLYSTSEKRLIIDLSGLLQCYERREIT